MKYGKHGKERQRSTLSAWCSTKGIELTSEDRQSMEIMAGSVLEHILFEDGMKLAKIDRIKELFISRFCGK